MLSSLPRLKLSVSAIPFISVFRFLSPRLLIVALEEKRPVPSRRSASTESSLRRPQALPEKRRVSPGAKFLIFTAVPSDGEGSRAASPDEVNLSCLMPLSMNTSGKVQRPETLPVWSMYVPLLRSTSRNDLTFKSFTYPLTLSVSTSNTREFPGSRPKMEFKV